MKACIVVPAFNEELTIKSVVSDLLRSTYPVFVVDDGSIDRTAELSRKAGARVISHESNRGNGAALTTGLEHAFANGFTDVLTLDADGAHRSDDVASVMRTHQEQNANLTIGSRFLDRDKLADIPSQKVDANSFAINMFNMMFKSTQTDVASGFRVLDKQAFEVTPHEESFSWTFGCLANCLRSGLNVCESSIGVRYDARELWATNLDELVDFLNFCSQTEPKLLSAILRLTETVTENRTCSVLVGGVMLYLHPISGRRSIIFQRQNQWYRALPPPHTAIDFDSMFGGGE